MCDVCCATSAIEHTKKGGRAVFYWNPDEPAEGLHNNPHAPPMSWDEQDAALAEAEKWPFINVRATGEPEGKGTVSFGFAHTGWSGRIKVPDVAAAMMRMKVDVRWDLVPDDHPVRDRDMRGLELLIRDWAAVTVARDAGRSVGRKLVANGKVAQNRLKALKLRALKGERFVPRERPHDWFAGFVDGMTPRPARSPRRKPSP